MFTDSSPAWIPRAGYRAPGQSLLWLLAADTESLGIFRCVRSSRGAPAARAHGAGGKPSLCHCLSAASWGKQLCLWLPWANIWIPHTSPPGEYLVLSLVQPHAQGSSAVPSSALRSPPAAGCLCVGQVFLCLSLLSTHEIGLMISRWLPRELFYYKQRLAARTTCPRGLCVCAWPLCWKYFALATLTERSFRWWQQNMPEAAGEHHGGKGPSSKRNIGRRELRQVSITQGSFSPQCPGSGVPRTLLWAGGQGSGDEGATHRGCVGDGWASLPSPSLPALLLPPPAHLTSLMGTAGWDLISACLWRTSGPCSQQKHLQKK